MPLRLTPALCDTPNTARVAVCSRHGAAVGTAREKERERERERRSSQPERTQSRPASVGTRRTLRRTGTRVRTIDSTGGADGEVARAHHGSNAPYRYSNMNAVIQSSAGNEYYKFKSTRHGTRGGAVCTVHRYMYVPGYNSLLGMITGGTYMHYLKMLSQNTVYMKCTLYSWGRGRGGRDLSISSGVQSSTTSAAVSTWRRNEHGDADAAAPALLPGMRLVAELLNRHALAELAYLESPRLRF